MHQTQPGRVGRSMLRPYNRPAGWRLDIGGG
jgi:hypothetical protein